MCAATFSSSAAASPVCARRSALAESGDVVILTKADPRESNTGYAQGGIAAAIGPDDSPELHARDTIAAGDGLCDPRRSTCSSREGPRYVRELHRRGAPRSIAMPTARPALGREAAHSVRRVLHARDATGREIGRAAVVAVSARIARIRVVRRCAARPRWSIARRRRASARAFVDRDGTRAAIVGARGRCWRPAARARSFARRRTRRSRPATALRWPFDAGARVADLEFVQFHPTVLSVAGAPRFLLSEALRGEGARLVNDAGERVHAALRAGRRSRVARSRVARDRPRGRAHRRAGVPVAGASRSRLRATALSDDRRRRARRRGSISRAIGFRSARPRTT